MKKIEKMNCEQLLAELRTSVTDYNNVSESDVKKKVELGEYHKNICDRYNEVSLLTVYSACAKDKNPILALAKAFSYSVVSVKDTAHVEVVDDVPEKLVTRSVKLAEKKLNIVKFIEWNEECNRHITADIAWRTPMNKARKTVEEQWEAFFKSGKDTHSMSIGKTKKALQAMVDALVFIEAEGGSGKNAVIVNGRCAKLVLGFSNELKDSKDDDGCVVIEGKVMSRQKWATLQLVMLHMIAENKDFTVEYGVDEEAPKAETDADTEAEA